MSSDKNGGSVAPIASGQVFGRWTVSDAQLVVSKKELAVLCICKCGTERLVTAHKLAKGKSTSCGCFAAEKSAARLLTHGGSYSAEYGIWRGILKRCKSPSCSSYPLYGGRGITVCDEWLTFSGFISDMGFRPDKRLSIERRDNDGPYSKSNCYWATSIEQNNNTRGCRPILFDGRWQTASMWAREFNMRPSTLRERLRRGWCIKDALGIPVGSIADNRNGGYKNMKDNLCQTKQ